MRSQKIDLDENKIVLGISGGVDSSTAALLLKEKGFTVVGLFFDIWPIINGAENEGAKSARELAAQIGIEYIYVNVSKEFAKIVIDNFCDEYIGGKTPNPCIVCNPNIKFKVLINTANQVGAKYIATGHYARTEKSGDYWYIKRAANTKKDQSYILYRLPQEIISRTIFPLGEIETKDLVREIARKNNLGSADVRDSQGICFVPKGESYMDFLETRSIKQKEGNFIDVNGQVIGRHKGIGNYTIGQKKGLEIDLGKQAFVKSINGKTQEITLTFDQKDLFVGTIPYTDVSFVQEDFFEQEGARRLKGEDPYSYLAKPRYLAPFSLCKIEKTQITLRGEQRAPTPGQAVVFYKDDLVIGGGIIGEPT